MRDSDMTKRPQIGFLQLKMLGTIDRLRSVEFSALKVILADENKKGLDAALRSLVDTGMLDREGTPYRYSLSEKGRERLALIRRYVRKNEKAPS